MEQVENLCWKIFDTEKRFFFTSTLPRSVPTNKGGMQKIGSLVGNTHLAFFFVLVHVLAPNWHAQLEVVDKIQTKFCSRQFFRGLVGIFYYYYKDIVGWDMAFPTRHDDHYRHFKHDIYLPMYN